jgi:hypothetical protein
MVTSANKQLWFRSGRFEIEPGEDAETNPGCYGKELAQWFRERLAGRGYVSATVVPEDWGWCVVCARKPIMLWVGCGVVSEPQWDNQSTAPSGSEVVWTCFVEAEKPFLTGFFKKIDPLPVEKLFADIKDILQSETSIQFVEEP